MASPKLSIESIVVLDPKKQAHGVEMTLMLFQKRQKMPKILRKFRKISGISARLAQKKCVHSATERAFRKYFNDGVVVSAIRSE